jgi:hypothetical protein
MTAGKGTNFRLPSMAFKSLAHNPLAATLTNTSPALGGAMSTSRTSNRAPTPRRTAAFIFMNKCPFI